jgi:DNA-directed RNA polymerase III subunit RPC1
LDRSNHIVEVESVLGIEASRIVLIEEVLSVMGDYDIGIDRRHVELVADIMTTRGSILGINRFGLQHMKESVLMLASFEKTTEFLFDAAVHAREDSICGVSECITLGIPVNLGTGSFKVLYAPSERGQARRRFPSKPLLLGGAAPTLKA